MTVATTRASGYSAALAKVRTATAPAVALATRAARVAADTSSANADAYAAYAATLAADALLIEKVVVAAETARNGHDGLDILVQHLAGLGCPKPGDPDTLRHQVVRVEQLALTAKRDGAWTHEATETVFAAVDFLLPAIQAARQPEGNRPMISAAHTDTPEFRFPGLDDGEAATVAAVVDAAEHGIGILVQHLANGGCPDPNDPHALRAEMVAAESAALTAADWPDRLREEVCEAVDWLTRLGL